MHGRQAVTSEMEEREKVREQLHGVRAWLEAADSLLSELDQNPNNVTQELQVGQL